jgi:cytochrome c oxidase subunit 2
MRHQLLVAAIVGVSIGAGSGTGAARQAEAPPAPLVVQVTAERFSFSPSEVKSKSGVPIEFVLRSDDTDHGFRILETDIDVRIPKRGKGTATVRFTPPRPGTYTIECSHVCGAGHSFMRATIVVK